MRAFKDKIVITFKLLAIEQKPHVFKQFINEKLERLRFIISIA